MRKSKATAEWQGDLKGGKGNMELGSGTRIGAFSFATRFGSEAGTNPEELIGAALAGCFSMALANMLSQEGQQPQMIRADAEVSMDAGDGGPGISGISLSVRGQVDGMDQSTFEEFAERAGRECPVSRALGGTSISVDAQLVS